MLPQKHLVRVFVYRVRDRRIEYLVVRHKPEHDSFWTPLVGVMNPDESIFEAAVRSVGEQVGLGAPRRIHDLQLATRFQIGDLDEIDWSVGYGTERTSIDAPDESQLAALRWLDFDRSYRDMDLEEDRRSIMRLHFTLRNASS